MCCCGWEWHHETCSCKFSERWIYCTECWIQMHATLLICLKDWCLNLRMMTYLSKVLSGCKMSETDKPEVQIKVYAFNFNSLFICAAVMLQLKSGILGHLRLFMKEFNVQRDLCLIFWQKKPPKKSHLLKEYWREPFKVWLTQVTV